MTIDEAELRGRDAGDIFAATRPPLTVVSTVDALVTDLTERILSAEQAPGVRLKESTLAQDYGVSRHTLRAALSRLTGAGLLVYSANKGWSVPELSIDDFTDVAFLRTALEVHALRELALRGEGIGPEAQAALGQIEAAEDDGDWVQRLQVDMRFHRALVDQAGSRRLSATYRDAQLSLHLYLVQRRDWFGPQSVQGWKQLHIVLARAVESGDPTLVERTVREQFSYTVKE